MSGAGSGMFELTNQSRLGNQGEGFLKRQELKQSLQTEGAYTAVLTAVYL